MPPKRAILGVTGHRPDKLGDEEAYDARSPIQDWCRREFRKVLKRIKPRVVISGMALGWDQWCALEALDFGADLHAYIPFEGQELRWWSESRVLYHELVGRAAKVKYISSPGYAAWKMQKRNEAVMDDCGIACSLFDGSSGGTFNCVEYADSIKRKRINIDPRVGLEFIERETAKFGVGTMYHYKGNLKWEAVRSVTEYPTHSRTFDDDLPF